MSDLSTTKPTHTRICWTDTEFDHVAKATATELLKQNIHTLPDQSDRASGSFCIAAASLAQQSTLPQERRRNCFTRQNYGPYFWDRVAQYLKMPQLVQYVPHQPEVPAPSPIVVKEEHKSEAVSSVTLPSNENHRVEVNVRMGRTPLEDYPTEELLTAVARRLSAGGSQEVAKVNESVRGLVEVVNKLERQVATLTNYDELVTQELDDMRRQLADMRNQVNNQERRVEERTKVETKDKVRVALIGCRKDEYDLVMSQITDLNVDLRHYDQDAKARPIHADWAIMMKWASHTWHDHVTNDIKRGQWTHCRGGISQVVAQLRVWFAKDGS